MLGLVLAGVGAGAAGCGGNRPKGLAQRDALAESARAASEESPVTYGGDAGVELRWLVTDMPTSRLGAVLARYETNPVPGDAETMELWRANGLRMVAVPLDEIAGLRARLRVVGATNRQWVGLAPRWVDAVTGPGTGPRTITMHDGHLELPAGRLRLLVRSWVVPVPPENDSGEAALRVELVPQHQEAAHVAARADPLLLTPEKRPTEAQGLVFARLRAALRFARGENGPYAVVLVPEDPDVRWEAPSGVSAEATPPVGEAVPPPAPGEVARTGSGTGAPNPPPALPAAPAPAPGPARPPGPPSPAIPSLGEAMLLARTERRGDTAGAPEERTLRAIVILIPHVPARFTVLGRSG